MSVFWVGREEEALFDFGEELRIGVRERDVRVMVNAGIRRRGVDVDAEVTLSFRSRLRNLVMVV